MFYIRTADRLQRTASWLESLDGGLDYLRSVIVDDSLGIGGELDAAVARHVERYEDEWAAVLADPERLRRFVSFVNAPGTPDPSIAFVSERGQPRPADLPVPVRARPARPRRWRWSGDQREPGGRRCAATATCSPSAASRR